MGSDLNVFEFFHLNFGYLETQIQILKSKTSKNPIKNIFFGVEHRFKIIKQFIIS